MIAEQKSTSTNPDGLNAAGKCAVEVQADASRLAAIHALAGQFTKNMRDSAWSVAAALQVELMTEAAELSAWPLVLKMHERMQPELHGHVDERSQLESQLLAGDAALQMGYLEQAESLLRRLLLKDPHQERALKLHHFLCEWKEFCTVQGMGLYRPGNGQELHLQLLGHQHLQSFAQIYSDETAWLCRLPDFHLNEDWHHWLELQLADLAERLFAVMHAQWGMVGVVSLVMHQQRGFFYYWIGEEFRGLGFGPAAVALLLHTGQELWDLHTCFAKTYEFNKASQVGLKKLGFDQLRIRAAPPSENELFYRLGPEVTEDLLVEEMRWFYECIGCEKRFLAILR